MEKSHDRKPCIRVVNLKIETCDVRIDRYTKWGNPFKIPQHGTRIEVVEMYREWISGRSQLIDELVRNVKTVGDRWGWPVTLGCWCRPLVCHGDILTEILSKKVRYEIL